MAFRHLRFMGEIWGGSRWAAGGTDPMVFVEKMRAIKCVDTELTTGTEFQLSRAAHPRGWVFEPPDGPRLPDSAVRARKRELDRRREAGVEPPSPIWD